MGHGAFLFFLLLISEDSYAERARNTCITCVAVENTLHLYVAKLQCFPRPFFYSLYHRRWRMCS